MTELAIISMFLLAGGYMATQSLIGKHNKILARFSTLSFFFAVIILIASEFNTTDMSAIVSALWNLSTYSFAISLLLWEIFDCVRVSLAIQQMFRDRNKQK
jgi:hypothetical protein